MRRPEFYVGAIMVAGVLALAFGGAGHAQALWKYTDKDGKVTYSDKAPKKGEIAQPVSNDPAANIIDAPKGPREGDMQKLQESKARTTERDNQRKQLRDALDGAKADLDAAKAALESGREPLSDEVQIVVGRSPTGAPTGANAVVRKPEYYARVTALEEAVKRAEAKVDIAERTYQRAP
ncbi:MAG: DUF4124 domain-containing protein [Betaproteobacteria bacterium]